MKHSLLNQYLFPRLNHNFYRLILFFSLFIILSGILGSRIISSRLLYSFYFFIYPNMGKMLIFSSIIFFLLIRDKINNNLTIKQFNNYNFFYLFASFILTILFFPVSNTLLEYRNYTDNISLSLLTHAIFISIPAFLALGIFGFRRLITFYNDFKKELFVCLFISILGYTGIWYIWQFWPYLSNAVLRSVSLLLIISQIPSTVVPPHTLVLKNFSVAIEQACSGLDSMFLFSSLYIIISVLDWKKLNHTKILFMFFAALLGLFFVNILRVYLLIMAGVFISSHLSATLFHTYLGMLLFIIYFIVFWKLSYRWMSK